MTDVLGICVALAVIIVIVYIAVPDVLRRERDRRQKRDR